MGLCDRDERNLESTVSSGSTLRRCSASGGTFGACCPYREVDSMNHLLTGTAFAAALVIAAPVWAQANAPMTRPSPAVPPSASTAAPMAPMASKALHHQVRMRRHHVMRRGMGRQSSPSDNVANQLNAQELGRVGG